MAGQRRFPLTAAHDGFDAVVLPHLGAARRLARWLIRNEADAEDVLQEASLRAFRYFGTFSGGDGRAWFLTIVRNTCRGWRVRPMDTHTDPFDEEQHSRVPSSFDPELLLHHGDAAALVALAMSRVPDRLRELLVLREVEGLSYRELADLMQLPMGTVMSRLSRARDALRRAMTDTLRQYGVPRRHMVASIGIRRALVPADASPLRRAGVRLSDPGTATG
jgi:RNA polymerase sigma-70 factor (ECF subfamily)